MSATQQPVSLADGSRVFLGRIRPVQVIETPTLRIASYPDGKSRYSLKLAAYFRPSAAAAPLPDAVDNWQKAMSGVQQPYGNRQQGDCVYASHYHLSDLWNAVAGHPIPPSNDNEVLRQYHEWEGPQDQGAIIEDVLRKARDIGINRGGERHKIAAYASVDWTNADLLKAVIAELGGVKFGVNLPQEWTCTDCTWGRASNRIVGGHDVPGGAYDSNGVTVATWGGLAHITWDGVKSRQWIEEAWAVISQEWLDQSGHSPHGFDLARLKADLAKLAAGQIPDIEPPAPPAPPAPPPGPIPPAVRGWMLKLQGTTGTGDSPKTAYDFAASLAPNFPPAPPPRGMDGHLRIGGLPPIPPEVWAWLIALIQSLLTPKKP